MNIFLDMEPLNEGFLDFIKKEAKKIADDWKNNSAYQNFVGNFYKLKDTLTKTKIPDSVYIEFKTREKILDGSFDKKEEMRYVPFPPAEKDENFYKNWIRDLRKRAGDDYYNFYLKALGKEKTIKLNIPMCKKFYSKISNYYNKFQELDMNSGDEKILIKFYPDVKEALNKNSDNKFYIIACKEVIEYRISIIHDICTELGGFMFRLNKKFSDSRFHYAYHNQK